MQMQNTFCSPYSYFTFSSTLRFVKDSFISIYIHNRSCPHLASYNLVIVHLALHITANHELIANLSERLSETLSASSEQARLHLILLICIQIACVGLPAFNRA